MVFLGAGIIVVILIGLASFFLGDWSILFKFSGIIGLVSCLISGLLSGVFVSGDRMRANYTNEDDEDKGIRQGWAFKLFLFGIPNLIGAIVYLVLIQ